MIDSPSCCELESHCSKHEEKKRLMGKELGPGFSSEMVFFLLAMSMKNKTDLPTHRSSQASES